MTAPIRRKTRAVTPLFKLGQLVSTPGAMEVLSQPGTDWMVLLMRHATGDWGDLSGDDKRANDLAVQDGDRILSAYDLPTGARIWIITEADRSATTLLLPEEY
jgi:2-keto-3-deoxy-L-rhamnonate aldolase RhmA